MPSSFPEGPDTCPLGRVCGEHSAGVADVAQPITSVWAAAPIPLDRPPYLGILGGGPRLNLPDRRIGKFKAKVGRAQLRRVHDTRFKG